MHIPFMLVVFIFLVLCFNYALHKNNKKIKYTLKEYIEEEKQANFARKKNIDENMFLNIDSSFLNELDLNKYYKQEKISRQKKRIIDISHKKMIYLDTSKQNKDIKLDFGISNFNLIVQYEENFVRFKNYCTDLAKTLIEHKEFYDAINILENLIKYPCDTSKIFSLLIDCYLEVNNIDKLNNLKQNIKNSVLIDNSKENLIKYIDSNKI